MYKLYRSIDRATHTGEISNLHYVDASNQPFIENNARPRANTVLELGVANWYNTGDPYYWTIIVSQVVSENETEVSFKDDKDHDYIWSVE